MVVGALRVGHDVLYKSRFEAAPKCGATYSSDIEFSNVLLFSTTANNKNLIL